MRRLGTTTGKISRSTPVRKVRPGTRRGQPTKEEKSALHDQVYAESEGRCEIAKHPKHISGVLPQNGDVLSKWHLVHIKAKRVHGWARENVCGGCYFCHIEYLHNAGGKPCPPKKMGDKMGPSGAVNSL